MWRVANISSSNIGVDGLTLKPNEFVELEKLSSDINRLQSEGFLSITDITDAGEDATIALEGALNESGDALVVVNYAPLNATGTVTDATPVVVDVSNLSWPKTIWVNPSSATVRVEVSENGGASYSPWPLGDVTTPSSDIRYDPCTHIKYTKISGTSFTRGIG